MIPSAHAEPYRTRGRGFRPIIVGCLLFVGESCLAAGGISPLGRAGLFSGPQFTGGSSEIAFHANSGWISGHSIPPLSATYAAWVMNPADGNTRRIGLVTSAEFFRGTYQQSKVIQLTESGWLRGLSESFLSNGDSNEVPWVANGSTGTTFRAGLTGPAFSSSTTGASYSDLRLLTKSGCSWGYSSRFQNNSYSGQAVWVMSGAGGVSFQVGLFSGAGFTDSSDGSQSSEVHGLTDSGWAYGDSSCYQGSETIGNAVWVANAATGTVRRLGYFTGAPYIGYRGLIRSSIVKVTEGGQAVGTSERFDSFFPGATAWVANASTGSMQRIGLFSGSRYVSKSDSEQDSWIRLVTDSGWICGQADLYDSQGSSNGSASWVAEAATGLTKRVGLYGGVFSSGNLHEYSYVEKASGSGWVCGGADRYGPTGPAGSGVWVARASTGVTNRVGLTSGEFTSSGGSQESRISALTESGWISGFSSCFLDELGNASWQGRGSGTWVADAATGQTRRIGLFGGEFSLKGGATSGDLFALAESGLVFGYSHVFQDDKFSGSATWVADALTGVTTPVGLVNGEFVSAAKRRDSKFTHWTNSGYVGGTANRYSGTQVWEANTPWVANARTGKTWRIGLTDPEYVYQDGYQFSRLTHLTEAGLAAGFSQRFRSGGNIAWVFDLNSGLQTWFNFSALPDGIAASQVKGITPEGLVQGVCYLPASGTSYGRPVAFLWAAGLGTMLLDEKQAASGAIGGWDYLEGISADRQGIVAGAGKPSGAAGRGVFYARPVAVTGSGPAIRITSFVSIPQRGYRLGFQTDTQVRLTLQQSQNLIGWIDAETMLAPVGESYLDIAGYSASNQRYWRLKAESVPTAVEP